MAVTRGWNQNRPDRLQPAARHAPPRSCAAPGAPRVFVAALLLLLCACDRNEPPATTQPVETVAATQPATPAPPPEPLLIEGSDTWSREEALQHLGDSDDLRTLRTAAVRLAQIAGALPDELPDSFIADLAVQSLGDLGWALGVAAAPLENADLEVSVQPLQMPLLLNTAGDLRPIDYDLDLATLYSSRDAEVFPHLVVTPSAVYALDQQGLQSAIVATDLRGGWFRWQFNKGYPYVIVHHPQAEDGELARYRWDPYELAFMGPLMQKAPAETGGLMALSLDESKLLIPVGGHVPTIEAAEREPELPEEDEELELPPF